MRRSRQDILSVFRNNTGGRTTAEVPRVEMDPVKLCGYQPQRVKKMRTWL